MSAAHEEVLIRLRPGREKAVLKGHPWLFSGAIASCEGPAMAPVARLVASDGRRLGVGWHSPGAELRVRLLVGAGGDDAVDRAVLQRRLAAALALRRELVPADTTGYRLANAEGDGLPGWTLDRFGEVVVSQITCWGLEQLREVAYAALAELLPEVAVFERNALPARRGEGLPQEDRWAVPPRRDGEGEPAAELERGLVWFREHGLRFAADLAGGQKTGFYCDQRDNRALVGGLAAGRRVLDLFAHSGAFAVHALRGGAAAVRAVESAARLEATARRHLEANALPAARFAWESADAFAWLRADRELYDLVVCDPPPLARHRGDATAAARAYKDLNRLALGRLAPGGLLLTFSCSGAVDAKLFRQVLFAAALEAGVTLQLLRPLAAALDHPVAVTHLEGEYLKGWLARVVSAARDR